MTTFHLPSTLLNTTINWTASLDVAPTMHSLVEGALRPANWPAIAAGLLFAVALAAAKRWAAKQLIVSTFRGARRVLAYLAKRVFGIIVDRLLEMLILALLAAIAGVLLLSEPNGGAGGVDPLPQEPCPSRCGSGSCFQGLLAAGSFRAGCGKECSGGAVDRAVSAASHFMQRAER